MEWGMAADSLLVREKLWCPKSLISIFKGLDIV